jgi:hypothetical protein
MNTFILRKSKPVVFRNIVNLINSEEDSKNDILENIDSFTTILSKEFKEDILNIFEYNCAFSSSFVCEHNLWLL